MDLPKFYRPERVGDLYVPDTASAVAAGRAANVNPADRARTRTRTILLLVDVQVDFVHTDGSLSVPGAVDDTRRTIEWIYRNLTHLTTIAASLDSHVPIQIFFPTWWSDPDGKHPEPYTVIRSEDLRAGRWRSLYQPEWSAGYCARLEADAKKELMIWPYHTLIGTLGHALTPALYEAIAYHAAARQAQPIFVQKGSIPETEHYSVLEAEVKVPGQPLSDLNTEFLKTLIDYDRIYIAGQAKSHCVLETVTSIMRYFDGQPGIIGKFRILQDCMSSVAHPTIDFEALADQAFEGFAAKGLKLVTSADAVG